MIQSRENKIVISGAGDGLGISVYTVSGSLVGSTLSQDGQAIISTDLPSGNVVIVKIGNKAIKILLK